MSSDLSPAHDPVTLAIETTTFHHIEDGRRRNEKTFNQRTYDFGRQAVLLDRAGTVRWLGEAAPVTEAVLRSIMQDVVQSR